MENLKELVELVRRCRAHCPWCSSQTVEGFLEHVISEVKELEEAIKSKDSDAISGELGDVLWVTIMLVHIADHEGISAEKVIREVNAKMMMRKPYIVTGEKVSLDKAMEIWNAAKKGEKAGK